jgi:hypothetical protein
MNDEKEDEETHAKAHLSYPTSTDVKGEKNKNVPKSGAMAVLRRMLNHPAFLLLEDCIAPPPFCCGVGYCDN